MSWMQTRSGIAFDLAKPRAEDVCREDIAWSLARICRYNGHTAWHYSVAQHCLLVAEALERDGHPVETVLGGLLHDASEAYIGDMTWPLKMASRNLASAIKQIGDEVDHAICAHFDIRPSYLHRAAVKMYDRAILIDESEVLLGPKPKSWNIDVPRLGLPIVQMPGAEGRWLKELQRLLDIVHATTEEPPDLTTASASEVHARTTGDSDV